MIGSVDDMDVDVFCANWTTNHGYDNLNSNISTNDDTRPNVIQGRCC